MAAGAARRSAGCALRTPGIYLPHCLNALYGAHPRWVIDTLFACTAQTLTEFAANPKWMGAANGKPALSLVLHTWAQDLLLHLHVHGVMACGVLDQEGRWVMPARKPDFLFPVEALSAVFRGKFMQALRTRVVLVNLSETHIAAKRFGISANANCTNTSGWCMPRLRWVAPPRCWST